MGYSCGVQISKKRLLHLLYDVLLSIFHFPNIAQPDTTTSNSSVDSQHARGTDSPWCRSPISFIFLGHLSFCLLFLIQVSFILMDFFRAFRPSEVLIDSSRVKDSSMVFCQLTPSSPEVSVGLLFQKIANFKDACNLLCCSAYTTWQTHGWYRFSNLFCSWHQSYEECDILHGFQRKEIRMEWGNGLKGTKGTWWIWLGRHARTGQRRCGGLTEMGP